MYRMNITDSTTDVPEEQFVVDLALMRAINLCRWLVPFIFGIIAFLGIVGNFLVIFTVCRQRAHRAVTYYYIVNLAVTDLAFLLCCVPFTATEYALPSWIFGTLLCKFSGFMKQVTGLATCTTLTAMTIDRYRAIVHPFRSLQSRTAKSAVIVSLGIWIGSSMYSLPYLIYKDTIFVETYNVTYCGARWPSQNFEFYYHLGTFFVVYFIPLAIIGICYAILLQKLWGFSFNERESGEARARMMQRKKHITLMILIVVLVFAGSWLPLHVVHLWRLLGELQQNTATYYLRTFSLCLAYSNSCVNPIVYAFVGGKFRERFLYACPGFCRLKIMKQDTMHLGHMSKVRTGSVLETTKRTKLLNSSDNTDGGKDGNCVN
ncbi:G-protein coupled receptor 54 [Holothuria leucospilota]|uniref:G-protein coupled receptor 54 n=1 Tax=Holothuria leucospilota TaxID=206669 RepID=A0A9Q1BGP3_HOLLE|nr:G-protein coupled receptor 54 [Holothuria leucospilota]